MLSSPDGLQWHHAFNSSVLLAVNGFGCKHIRVLSASSWCFQQTIRVPLFMIKHPRRNHGVGGFAHFCWKQFGGVFYWETGEEWWGHIITMRFFVSRIAQAIRTCRDLSWLAKVDSVAELGEGGKRSNKRWPMVGDGTKGECILVHGGFLK